MKRYPWNVTVDVTVYAENADEAELLARTAMENTGVLENVWIRDGWDATVCACGAGDGEEHEDDCEGESGAA